MPSPSPIDRQSASFNRKTLRRSVIAIPLREAIEAELAETERLKEQYGQLLKRGHNAAIFFRMDAPKDPDEILERVRAILDEALTDVGAREKQRIDKPLDKDGQWASLAHLDGLVARQ